MKVVALKESARGEKRLPLTPQSVSRLVKLGASVGVESGFGEPLRLTDADFEASGAVIGERSRLLTDADLVVWVQPPAVSDITAIRPDAAVAGFLDPFFNPTLVTLLARGGVDALCMELIPRSTYAQKMDALSSQASLAGYAAVVLAAQRIDKVFPMMSTPAGTIAPARVLVIGAGVAGLQAIATAKRLGARVEAYDTRPVVKEQVMSLGARFVEIDVGDTGQTAQGYARELTDGQLARLREQMAAVCASADVIVTTAQVFGRRAPRIVTSAMVAGMKPGSVIVDMAAATGGNVEGTLVDREVVTDGGVTIVGLGNLPAEVARDASHMYANNLYLLIEHAWDAETGTLALDPADEVIGATLLTSGGVIRDERVRVLVEGST